MTPDMNEVELLSARARLQDLPRRIVGGAFVPPRVEGGTKQGDERPLPTDISQEEVEEWVDLAMQWISEEITECAHTKRMWSDPVCKGCDWLNVCGVLVDIIDQIRAQPGGEERHDA